MIGLATAAGLGLAVLVVLVTLLWLISLRLRDASIVDVFWGLGFVALNLVYVLLTPDGTPARKVTATVLVSLWGIRLAAHLLARNRRRRRISATPLARTSRLRLVVEELLQGLPSARRADLGDRLSAAGGPGKSHAAGSNLDGWVILRALVDRLLVRERWRLAIGAL